MILLSNLAKLIIYKFFENNNKINFKRTFNELLIKKHLPFPLCFSSENRCGVTFTIPWDNTFSDTRNLLLSIFPYTGKLYKEFKDWRTQMKLINFALYPVKCKGKTLNMK